MSIPSIINDGDWICMEGAKQVSEYAYTELRRGSVLSPSLRRQSLQQYHEEVTLIQRRLFSNLWPDPGKITRGQLHPPCCRSMSKRSRHLPLLNLPRRPTVKKPLRHKDQRIERPDPDRKPHRSKKDDHVTRALPLARLPMISPADVRRQVSELRRARHDPLAHRCPRFQDNEDDVIDCPKGMGRGGVEEVEEAPEGRIVVASICTCLQGFRAERARVKGAEDTPPGGFGDGPGSVDEEQAKGQRFLDEVREAVDGRVRGDVLGIILELAHAPERRCERGGTPPPETKNRPLSGAARSCPLLRRRNSSLATRTIISLQSIPNGIDTDIKGTYIDLCAFEPGHDIDPQPRHIRYRHRCLSPRQRNLQAREFQSGRTKLVNAGKMLGIDIDPGAIAGPADGHSIPAFGAAPSLTSRPPIPSLSVSPLSLRRRDPPSSLSPRGSEPALAAVFLEQCRQRSLDAEDQQHGQDVVCARVYGGGHVLWTHRGALGTGGKGEGGGEQELTAECRIRLAGRAVSRLSYRG